MLYTMFLFLFCFFKQKTAYEMRISDWSSDVCSSDLICQLRYGIAAGDQGREQTFGRGTRTSSGWAVQPHDRTAGTCPEGTLQCESLPVAKVGRSEERRVGNECIRTCRSQCSPKH